MKRRTVHLVYGVLVAGCAAMALLQAWHLQRAQQLAADVAAAGNAAAPEPAQPEARVAHAIAQAREGRTDPALTTFKSLIQSERPDVRRTALYDLGNLYLREALKGGPEQALRAGPLVELAKQAYRDLLREDPADWDARYNLELALRIAPEVEEQAPEELSTPPMKERSVSTVQGAKIDLP